MKISVIFHVLIVGIVILLIVRLVMFYRSLKLNERISKYTVNNDKIRNISFGDKLTNIYKKFENKLLEYLKKSAYFKKRALSYEKYSYVNNSLNIIATKFCISILLGIIYLLSALARSSFDYFIFVLCMVFGYFLYDIYLIINEKVRNKYIEDDLLKAIIIMNNAFKSGYNITQAIDMVSKDLTGPIREEFIRIGNDLKYGLELSDVFDRFYNRVKIDDVKYMTSSLSLLNLTGGNLVGIFESIEKSFTNRRRINDELDAMTSSSKLVFYILLIMPFIIIISLIFFSPSYFNPLINNLLGIIIIIIALILYISYILIIRKILKIEK